MVTWRENGLSYLQLRMIKTMRLALKLVLEKQSA